MLAALIGYSSPSLAGQQSAAVTPQHQLTGVASWYGRPYHGRRTASGERFDRNAMTAAHPSLPLHTMVRVVDVATGRAVIVRINDRGPGYGRAIDLSEAAARALGTHTRGLAEVEIHHIADRLN